ncbi:hypothetical protein RJT34_01388 [Clitoria ternatea]|uniref:Uncharacterized protein n=1 Tax=Clitoria ternatea TaxID=43366 RepID=A0AAN9KJD4_CLITE
MLRKLNQLSWAFWTKTALKSSISTSMFYTNYKTAFVLLKPEGPSICLEEEYCDRALGNLMGTIERDVMRLNKHHEKLKASIVLIDEPGSESYFLLDEGEDRDKRQEEAVLFGMY